MNNPSPGEKDLITIEEAAGYYNLNTANLRRYLRKNECRSFVIPYYGNRKLILRHVFESYLFENPDIKELIKIDAGRQRKGKA